MRYARLASLAVALLAVPHLFAQNQAAPAYVPVHVYDPARDPAKDLQAAVVEAKRTGKRILLNIGGDWCGWCKIMDRYFEANPPLLELREKNFIMLKINWSPANRNEAFFAKYPTVVAYPYLFVLESDGRLLHSQRTGPLESGSSYDLKKFTDFLKAWVPKK